MISARNITTKKVTTLNSTKGFTLIELLVVIGILAVLLAIVLVAINPARQFAQANDTKRRSDATAILNAIGQYSADHKGDLSLLAIPASPTTADAYTLCAKLVPTYLSLLPTDPKSASNGAGSDCAQAAGFLTKYNVTEDANNRVTVTGTVETPGGDPITVTR